MNKKYNDIQKIMNTSINENKKYNDIKNILNNNINLCNNNGESILMLACKKLNIKICELLLNKGADVNIQDNIGNTALIYTCMSINKNNYKNNNKNKLKKKICELLISKGAYINLQNKKYKKSALFYTNDIGICELLINNGADINLQNYAGDTKLILACYANNIDIYKLLIEKGADINLYNNHKDSVLMIVCFHSNIEIFKLLESYELLESHEKINFCLINKDGNSALSLACMSNGSKYNIELFKNIEYICNYLISYYTKYNYKYIFLKNNKGEIPLIILYKLFTKNNRESIIGLYNLYFLLIKKDNSIEEFMKFSLIKNEGRDYNNILIFLNVRYNLHLIYKNEKINIQKIIDFYYDIYYYYLKKKINLSIYRTYECEINDELKSILENLDEFDHNNIKTFRINIKYKGSNSINLGGLSKNFFDNIETSINSKFNAIIELDNKTKKINYELFKIITILNKNKNFKNKNFKNINGYDNKILFLKKIIINNNNNTIIDLMNNIEKINKEIHILKKYANKEETYDIYSIIKILAISKINNKSIYYMNVKIKNYILNLITLYFNKKIEKNYIYNILNYLSNVSSDDTLQLRNIILSKKNKEMYPNNINNYNKFNKEFIKKKYLKNNNKNIQSSNNNENTQYENIQYENIQFSNNDENTQNESIQDLNHETNSSTNNDYIKFLNILRKKENKEYLKILNIIEFYIEKKVYDNIYDFFLSHFVNIKINKENFLKKLKFEFKNILPNILLSSNNKNENERIKKEIIEIFNNFTEEELYLFNKIISGNYYKIADIYTINIYISNKSPFFNFHTCFNTMDINYILFKKEFFDKNYFKKDYFINTLKTTINNFTKL